MIILMLDFSFLLDSVLFFGSGRWYVDPMDPGIWRRWWKNGEWVRQASGFGEHFLHELHLLVQISDLRDSMSEGKNKHLL